MQIVRHLPCTSEGCTTSKLSMNRLSLREMAKPKAAVRVNEYFNSGHELALSSQVLLIRLRAYDHYLTRLSGEINCSHPAYFSHEEQIIIMEGFENTKN